MAEDKTDKIVEYFANVDFNTTKSDDCRTIAKTQVGASNSFGQINIKSMEKCIYNWKIRINKASNNSNLFDEIGGVDVPRSIKNLTSNATIAIGIASDPSTMFVAFGFNAIFGDKNSFNYGYWSDGKKQNRGCQGSYGKSYTARDIITIKLDTFNKTIEFFHNGTSQGISDNIQCKEDISYCLAVFMRGKDDSITVQDFEKSVSISRFYPTTFDETD